MSVKGLNNKEYSAKYRREHKEEIQLYSREYKKKYKNTTKYKGKKFKRNFWNNFYGVYEIVCLVNNNRYIGRTINFSHRKNGHFSKLKKQIHDNCNLQKDYNLYGRDNFQFNPLIICNKDDAIKYEQYFMDLYKEKNLNYNIEPNSRSSIGTKHNEETRRKISKSLTGRKLSEECLLKRSKTVRKFSHLAHEWKNLHDQGLKINQIAKLYNTKWSNVDNYINKYKEVVL
jgi:group I intron endonuclease